MDFFFEFIERYIYNCIIIIYYSYLHKKIDGKSFFDVNIPDIGIDVCLIYVILF
jgi:hypothetical protein